MSILDEVRSGKEDIVEYAEECMQKAKGIDREYRYFTAIAEESAIGQAREIKKNFQKYRGKRLLGVMVSAKDAICVKGVESCAGSRILKGYRPLFDATVIERVKREGGIVIGKTSQDEFGFGSFSVNVGLGFPIPLNPFDRGRSCGGSSGGAAGLARKADFPHIALGESTGGSIAAPSSFCGVFGLTPTYGKVSRYGLIDYGNSLDKIGSIGKSVEEVALLQGTIEGHDPKDSTSLSHPHEGYKELKRNVKGMRIGVIKEAFSDAVEKDVQKGVRSGIARLEEEGAVVEEVSLEFPIRYSLATYYLLAMSESSTNLARYCGMRYGQAGELKGNFNEYFSEVRSKHFGEEAKRRIILGTFARMSGFRDAYYIKAAKVRTLIIRHYRKAFGKYDALASPSTPLLPPKFTDIEKLTPLQHYMIDVPVVGPNLAGLPHLNVPVGMEKGLPVGMLLIGDHLQERKLLEMGMVFDGE
ncbi:TPA: Asp-tRNA(Asn)/Glu-tRNA(Gln) amidotransferase subunit GatA [Candidatus Woesearchaeota archaeon]|nr:MAG: aspartyl-tRNA(Asn)/glutamyl-tRNA (Gln) amidotransferase subunit A [archaeon GW2011_AR11]HIH05454.1 Asp-tRNA(Asn)/Glu-tRNA(Gln) amidotransferase subunit GatA [Candidatus Woesearchaeota archaeon]HII65052.1 Asp-tRNA(Asn)/Glu-tRNA(Gln) amidotransferase subunit GatA [Candidatus Woesearchaeota archaeon]HIJ19302.1 Asp-tRNA(Asn)/Glu-tRNA(Gln) amidotransferase subunit GatA [Candidatus Woesearchaeota archaeon]